MNLRVLVFLLLSITVLNSQNTVGTTEVNEDIFDGYTLFTVHKKTYLINNCGQVINEWSSNYLPGNSVYLLPNGNVLRAGRTDDSTSTILFGGRGGIVELFDWDGNIIWSYTYSSNQYRQHHDAYPMPNGNVLILAATVMTNAEAIDAGRDPALLSEIELYNEQIIEVEPVGTDQANIVWEWNIKDHLIQDFDATKSNYGVVQDNPRKLDINFLNGWDSGKNWLHINSIQYDAMRDQIVLSSRRMSEMWIIDHSTTTSEASSSSGGIYGLGGDFLYRWGNPQSYELGDTDDRRLYGQHMPYIIPDGLPNSGKIIVFNNGIGRTPLYSSVDLLDPPVSSPGVYDYQTGTSFGPSSAEVIFPETAPTEDSEFFSAILSSAQQLPNGNILVCEGREGHFFELDDNNNIVWDYIIPIDSDTGLSTEQGNSPPLSNVSFRAIKYDPLYTAFEGRDLTPMDPLEINPDISSCLQTLSNADFNSETFAIYPNPTSNYINVKTTSSNLNIDKVEVYNLSGQRLMESFSSSIDLSIFDSGIYFVKVTSNGTSNVKRVIKL